MLVFVKVDTIDATGRRHLASVEEVATQLLADVTEGLGETDRALVTTRELWSDRPARVVERGRGYHEDRWHRHARLDGGLADGLDQCSDALRTVPRIVLVHRLEVVGAKEKDHHVQGTALR